MAERRTLAVAVVASPVAEEVVRRTRVAEVVAVASPVEAAVAAPMVVEAEEAVATRAQQKCCKYSESLG